MQRKGQKISFSAEKSLNTLAASLKSICHLKLGIVVATVLAVAGLCVVQSVNVDSSTSPINLAKRLFVPFAEKNASNTYTYEEPAPRKYHDVYLPAILSAQDIETYKAIFAAQKKADWNQADQHISKLNNQILLGHVLADRYLHRKYTTSYEELKAWMKNYADMPAANDIYKLTLNKKPSKTKLGIRFIEAQKLKGYGDAHGNAKDTGLTNKPGWQSALNAYSKGDKAGAARLFSALAAKSDDMSSWDASAVHYWAYRTHTAIGDHKKASYHIRMAASAPRSFYGIIARKRLGLGLDLHIEDVSYKGDDFSELYDIDAVKRAVALREINEIDMAEQEMRQLFPEASQPVKQKLLALATVLDMPAVQMRMGRTLSGKEQGYDYAVYPTPRWKPKQGFNVDPALLFAYARQESGFNSDARSTAGAIGLMQIMPQTAQYIAKKVGPSVIGQDLSVKALSDPEANITLGQHYIAYLMEQENIGDNLFFLAASYNAGPGKVAEWQKNLRYGQDPLLFVESIPYDETRNHLKQVMTSYWIYSELMGKDTASLTDVASGEWPRYSYKNTGKNTTTTVRAAATIDRPRIKQEAPVQQEVLNAQATFDNLF